MAPSNAIMRNALSEIDNMCKNCKMECKKVEQWYAQYFPGSEVSELCECDRRCQCWNNASMFVKLQNEIPDFILHKMTP